jgi:hypothetical protein
VPTLISPNVGLKLLSMLVLLGSWGLEPSFRLEECSKNATDIVVVARGDRFDGIVEVEESWKGDLMKGDRIALPDLAAFESEKARAIAKRLLAEDDLQRPKYVTCARMVLFLIRKKEKTSDAVFKPASVFGQIRVSLAWIENERVYAFGQELNPGKSALLDWNMKESELKEQVLRRK